MPSVPKAWKTASGTNPPGLDLLPEPRSRKRAADLFLPEQSAARFQTLNCKHLGGGDQSEEITSQSHTRQGSKGGDQPLKGEKEITMPLNENQIEAEIQSKNLNAPRLTPALIDDTILAEQFYVFPGTTLTVCALTLRNGFTVVGESAAASPENFDEEIGQKIARDNARNKIWPLEGYLLRSRLSEQTQFKS